MKKNLKLVLFIAIFSLVGFMAIGTVDAATVKGHCCSKTFHYNTNYKNYVLASNGTIHNDGCASKYSYSYQTYGDKRAFCLEKGVSIRSHTGNYKKIATLKKDSTGTKNIYIARAIGFTGSEKCSDKGLAGGLLVQMISKNYKDGAWKTVSMDVVKGFANDSGIASNFKTLRNKVLKYNTAPSFTKTSESTAKSNAKYLKYDSSSDSFSLSLTDSNEVISLYGMSVSSKNSNLSSASISGNKLTVKAKRSAALGKGNMCVKLSKSVPVGDLYKDTTSQDTAVVLDKSTDKQYYYVCFKTTYVKVIKKDQDTSKILDNASYRIYNDLTKCKNYKSGETKKTATLATNSDSYFGTKKTGSTTPKTSGAVYFINPKGSTFYVREITPPKGYKNLAEADNCKKVTIDSGKYSASVEFKNKRIGETDVQVIKYDKYEGSGLSGVSIGIYKDNSCKTVLDSAALNGNTAKKQTDKSGVAEWNDLRCDPGQSTSTYYVKEEQTPTGYVKDPTEKSCKAVTVKCQAVTDTTTTELANAVEINNIPYGNIKLYKKDLKTNKPMQGVVFKILDEKKQPAKNVKGNVIGEVTTDKSGYANFNDLAYGKYLIQEVKTINGYKLITEPIEFILNSDTDAKNLAKNNEITYTIGDLNNDGMINADDLAKIAEILTSENKGLGLDKKVEAAADINKDNEINSKDQTILSKYIEKNISSKQNEINNYSELIKKYCDNKNTEDCVKVITNISNAYNNIYLKNKETTGAKAGDLNNDGKINKQDVEILQNVIDSEKSAQQTLDFDSDTKITANDRLILEFYIANEGKMESEIAQLLNVEQSLCTAIESDSCAEDLMGIININKKGTIPTSEAIASIIITNDTIEITISKQDIANSEEVPGATIVIKDANGKVYKKYVSKDEPTTFAIPEGTYTLTETVAPKGYQSLKTTVKFKIDGDGNVKILSAASNMYKVTKDEEQECLNHLIIYNKVIKEKEVKIPNTANNAKIITIIAGTILVIGGLYVANKKFGEAEQEGKKKAVEHHRKTKEQDEKKVNKSKKN